jgi:hypothetical protein
MGIVAFFGMKFFMDVVKGSPAQAGRGEGGVEGNAPLGGYTNALTGVGGAVKLTVSVKGGDSKGGGVFVFSSPPLLSALCVSSPQLLSAICFSSPPLLSASCFSSLRDKVHWGRERSITLRKENTSNRSTTMIQKLKCMCLLMSLLALCWSLLFLLFKVHCSRSVL